MRSTAKLLTGIVTVTGRILLCAVFVAAASGYASTDVQRLASTIAARANVPASFTQLGAVILLAAACTSVVLGYKARAGAVALLAFLVASLWLFHSFTIWSFVNHQARQEHIAYLLENLSIMGGTLVVAANGAGQMSIDNHAKR
jgi:putative oxidoreductase